MQIRISDLMDDCCPEGVALGAADAALTQRIKADVLNKIKNDAPRPGRRNVTRILLLAAVIASLMTATAFAAGLFGMHRETVPADEIPSGYWRFYDDEGKLTEEQKLSYPDAGMVFTFYGPEDSEYNLPEFSFGWLPEEGEHYEEQKSGSEDWMYSYGQMCNCELIPCKVNIMSVPANGYRGVLNGEVAVIKEETWDCWAVTEIQVDYTHSKMVHWSEPVNYIFMFDEERGYLVMVKGCEGMDTLEKIAKNLEIRESDTPPTSYGSPLDEVQIGCFDMGRG